MGFCPVGFCPVGFCPVGFCQCGVLSCGVLSYHVPKLRYRANNTVIYFLFCEIGLCLLSKKLEALLELQIEIAIKTLIRRPMPACPK